MIPEPHPPRTVPLPGMRRSRRPLRMAKATTLLPLPRYWVIGPLKELFEGVPPAHWTAIRRAYLRGVEDAEAVR